MSKNAKPTVGELKFVYGLLLKGDKVDDILEEYAELFEAGTLKFPYRVDKRFVEDRQREFEAAKEVLSKELKAKIKKELDPITIERKKEHSDKLARVADELIYNLGGLSVSKVQLSEGLKDNLFYIQTDEYNPYYKYLFSHLNITSENFRERADDDPEGLIDMLEELSLHKAIDTKCDICKNW